MAEFVACEVVCDFEGRRRPVSFCFSESQSVKDAHDSLFSSVKVVFSDLIRWEDEDSYFLQVNSDKHGVIDVLGCTEPVVDGQTVYLRYWSRKTSPENDVSQIANSVHALACLYLCRFPMPVELLNGCAGVWGSHQRRMQRRWLAFFQHAHLRGDLTHTWNALLLNPIDVRRPQEKDRKRSM